MSGPQRSRAGGVRDFPPEWQEEAGVLERRILGRSGNGISCRSLTKLYGGFVVGWFWDLIKITSTKLLSRRQAVCTELSAPVSFRVFPKILHSPVIAAYSHRGKVSVSVLTGAADSLLGCDGDEEAQGGTDLQDSPDGGTGLAALDLTEEAGAETEHGGKFIDAEARLLPSCSYELPPLGGGANVVFIHSRWGIIARKCCEVKPFYPVRE